LDAFFDLRYILEDITDRTYITLGFTSFLLLIPLVVTSTNAMVRRLGGQRWRRLHRLAYVVAAGGALHFLWLVKADVREPLIYLGILLLLLLARVPAVAERLAKIRTRSVPAENNTRSHRPAMMRSLASQARKGIGQV
jgi:sulfoxide reductase heme-binding subunit YedZ